MEISKQERIKQLALARKQSQELNNTNSAHLVDSCANISIDNNNTNLPSGANLSSSTLSHICSLENTAVSIDNTEINENTNASVALFSNEEVLPSGAISYSYPLSHICCLDNITGSTIDTENIEIDNALLALFFNDTTTLYIPKKIETNLKRYVSKELLKKINENIDVAIEQCMIFLNNFSSTFYTDSKYKTLSSQILREQFGKNIQDKDIYISILNVLKAGTKQDGPMIEILTNEKGIESYSIGNYSKQYKLTSTYLNVGLTTYNMKNEVLINKRNKMLNNLFKIANKNTIANNLINLYGDIDLPTTKELLIEGKKLSKAKTKTKKNKIITLRNKHVNEYWNDSENRSFVEDDIELFSYLTKNNFMIPIIGGEKSGGRVVDSFTLMPSWIRNLVKIDGEKIVEVDFKALHPNIAMTIYGGSKKYLTHQYVADVTGIDIKDIKVEHLSFFNKEVWQMKKSPLYSFYSSEEPTMIKEIEEDKYNSANKHKITAMKMFKLEVDIMTETIKRLNNKGIYVGYVYDALFCKESDAKEVADIMNEVAIKFGVYTIADYKGVPTMNDISKVKQDIISIEIEAEMVAKIDMVEEYEELIEEERPELDMNDFKIVGRNSQTKFDKEVEHVKESKQVKPMSMQEYMKSQGFN